MKSTEPLSGRREGTLRHGAALILVLVFLALLSVLVVTFFSSVQSEVGSARTYVSTVTVKQLADNATNIVMGQILDGTQSFSIPGDTTSRRLTWASQPGLIRTYGDDGNPARTFKLYSSANMVEAAGSDYIPVKELTHEVPDNWPSAPALFVDLNKPVLVADVQGGIAVGKGTYSANYPIIDPLAMLNHGVEGFSIQSAPGFPSASWNPDPAYDPTQSGDTTSTANPAPMPVRWLYVLKDGTITAPDDGGTKTATWTATTGHLQPSKTNPIVGRIAFWTDDETCKLNVNTASEGIFWDRAWANSSNASSPYAETQLNTNVPVRGEFYRYPGHPAMTCLSPVFGGLIPSWNPPTPLGDNLSSSDYTNYYKPYYDLVPRVNAGGSMGGTVTTWQATTGAISPDANRLYASLDELMFAAPDGTDPAMSSLPSARTANPNITKTVLERAKFFLTTYNRAPEVNAFGRPRICLWPLQQPNDPSGIRPRNARDEMIAFCSTIHGQPYYFQRYSIYQGAINNDGKFRQTPPPSSQHPSLDWLSVARNQQLYAYLQNLTDTPVPGWGKKLTDKYPAGIVRDQILTEMVDLIRSGVNTYAIDPALTPKYYFAPSRSNGAAPGETSVVPLVLSNGTKGTGRFPTVTEAALVFYATDKDDKGNATAMRCALVLQPYTPMAGMWTYSPLVHYKITGLDQFTINGASAVFRPELHNLVTSRCGYGSGSNHSEAFTGLFASFRRWASAGGDQNKVVPEVVAAGMDPEVNYCLVSDKIPIDVTANKGKFAFIGGTITVEIYGGYGTNPTPAGDMLVQSISMNFPSADAWPQPLYDDTYHDFNVRLDGSYGHIFYTTHTIINPTTGASTTVPIDTVRSVQVDPLGPTKGDLRMVTGKPIVPANYYAPFPGSNSPSAPGYFDPNAMVVFSMRNGSSAATGASIYANLFTGTGSSPGSPIAARGLKGALLSNGLLGDFDNGAYTRQDGAYCNKPDDYFGSDGSGDQYGSQIVSPNRQVCSAVMFGSLPTGVFSNQPWQTLLFCPNPAAGPDVPSSSTRHPGFQTIHDHVFLDFFTMPVVEPYAISEPCSTAGKVNLNYQIAPFTYITRSTALRGVLKSTRVMAIPTSATNYKSGAGAAAFRLAINRDETLKGFEQRFATASPSGIYNGNAGAFRSASEICDMFLVPSNSTFAAMRSYWQNYALTGDNAREFPYSHIYQRVTTKSNVFTIHMCVQVLKKNSSTDPTQWVEGKDTVSAEFRGSSMIERYVDPSDPRLPDFATVPSSTLDSYYRFRVLSTKRFAP